MYAVDMRTKDARPEIEAMFKEAILLRDAGEFAQAIRKLDDVLLATPNRRAPILGVMGHIYFKMGNLDKAMGTYKEAVALSPNRSWDHLACFIRSGALGVFRRPMKKRNGFWLFAIPRNTAR